MSWYKFKQNLINKLCNAKQVPDINYVAKAFAEEYDAAIKNGGTIPDNIRVNSGNTQLMETLFLAALQKGLSATEPYDLVGEMGKGVKAYWSSAQLNPFPIPLPTPQQLATSVIANTSATSNSITDVGIWNSANDVNQNTINPTQKVDNDDDDVVNNKVDEKQTDTDEKPMPPVTSDFNLEKIPDALNNYRSGQIPVRFKSDGTLDGPYPEIIKKYGIKTIIRMNADGSDGRDKKDWPITTIETEKKMCEQLGCQFYFINAHEGYIDGNGYQGSLKKIVPILSKGNTLIHCAHGADRTGGHVGGYLKKMGIITDVDKIWDYTVQFNNWENKVAKNTFFGSGYDKYAFTFYPEIDLKEKLKNPGLRKQAPPPAENPPADNNNKKILIVGDSISVDVSYTWSGRWKAAAKDLDIEILAKGGEQLIAWMRPQLEARLQTKKYDKVYIYGGVNDAYSNRSLNQFLTSLQSMVDTVKKSGAQPVVIVGYDGDLDMDTSKMTVTRYVKSKEEYDKIKPNYIAYQAAIPTRITGAKIVPKITLGVLSDGFHPYDKEKATKLYQHISKY